MNEYEEQRNKLIPLAVMHANYHFGKREPLGYGRQNEWTNDWNQCYLAEMDRLWGEVE